MENFQLNKKTKAFLFITVLLPFIGLFGWVFFNAIIDTRSSGEIYLSLQLEKNCLGRVETIYRQEMNHNVLTLKTERCIFQVPYKWENKFLVGDSISKKEGELLVKHYRGGRLIEILDYHDVAKDMK